MNYFVTGCAGFVGSSVVDRLLAAGHSVRGYDNFSTGRLEFLAEAERNPRFTLTCGDLLDLPALTAAMRGAEFVFHFAANADVRFGTEHPRKDLEQNTIGTFHVLEAMRATRVRGIAFSSTGSIYGEPDVFPTPETAPFPLQTSLYAASKLAGEGPDSGLLRRGTAFAAISSASFPCWASATRTGMCSISIASCRPIPMRSMSWAMESSGRAISTFKTASTPCCWRSSAPPNPSTFSIWARTSTARWTNRWAGFANIWALIRGGSTRAVRAAGSGTVRSSFLIARIRALGWAPRLQIREAVIRTLTYLQTTQVATGMTV